MEWAQVMTLGEQLRWWGLALLALFVFVWAFSGAVTPFLAGMALAYFLDPLADRLEARGLSRLAATCVITVMALAAAVAAVLVLVPLLLDQVNQVIAAAPQYVAALQGFIERQGAAYAPEAFGDGGVLTKGLAQFEAQAKDWSIKILGTAWSSGLALIDFLALMIITPVVAFYMLLDWDRMIDEIDHWL
ncbi:MAG: AI-2E family transporter, partial [Alphaproteobacteria bacterium HGW-Alphaproteobacteria-10]